MPRSQMQGRSVLLLSAPVVFAVLVVCIPAVRQAVQGASVPVAPITTALPTATPPSIGVVLPTATISSTTTAFLSAKQALVNRIHQLRSDGARAPQPAENPLYVPPATTPEPWQSGIIQSGQATFPRGMYTINNRWQDVVGGQHLQVFAGADGTNPAQGIVIVQTVSLDLQTINDMVYKAPTQNGALRVVAANGTRLTLTTTNGQSVVFDAVARNFAL